MHNKHYLRQRSARPSILLENPSAFPSISASHMFSCWVYLHIYLSSFLLLFGFTFVLLLVKIRYLDKRMMVRPGFGECLTLRL